MHQYTEELKALLNSVPRRHSADNVKTITGMVNEYENILQQVESLNPYYEKNTADLFSGLDEIRLKIKMSNDNKASKKNKDVFFDEASGALKDSIQSLIDIYDNGSKE